MLRLHVLGRLLLAALLLTLGVRNTLAQSVAAIKRISVRVSAASGDSVFLDKGCAAGIEPGNEVLLFPPGRNIAHATIQSVSRTSSRCTVDGDSPLIEIGTRGEVLARIVPPADGEEISPPTAVPDHPEWTHPPENWNQDLPLLAPAGALDRNQREREIHGRVYGQYLYTWNRSAGNNQYSLGRFGTSLWIENPFYQGGELRFDGELNRQGAILSDEIGDIDNFLRCNRFSYYWGGTDEQPLRYEIGRFVPSEFSEFGLLDGAEITYRTPSGHQVGFSVGLLPVPFPSLSSGDDFQVAVFYRIAIGDNEMFSTGVGFQKTWHEGTPDRDLLVLTADYLPNDHFSVYGTLWTDFYDARDTLKSSSAEISQAIIQPVYQFDPGHGVGAYLTYLRYPQLLRQEYSPLVEEEIVEDRPLRYGLYTWQQLGTCVRLDGRIDQWHDQQVSGINWDAGVTLRDLLFSNGDVALSVYQVDGLYSSGPGVRLSAHRCFGNWSGYLAYDVADYQFNNRSVALVQQSVRANVDVVLPSAWSLTFSGDYNFGQHQNALQVGTYLQRRF